MRRRYGLVLAWLVATSVAIGVGLLAVSGVGASITGRGPLGSAVLPEGPEPSVSSRELPAAGPVEEFAGSWGVLKVRCRGAYAVAVAAEPAPGWRTVSYEQGPDDDVDAVFSSGRRSVELEVYCNQGRPTLSDLERNTLPEDD